MSGDQLFKRDRVQRVRSDHYFVSSEISSYFFGMEDHDPRRQSISHAPTRPSVEETAADAAPIQTPSSVEENTQIEVVSPEDPTAQGSASARSVLLLSGEHISPTSHSPKPLTVEICFNRRRQSRFYSWLLEIGALVLSIGSTIATIAVLASQNGKPLSDWRFVTSLNTVISTLGALSRTFLAFTLSACIGQQKWNWFRCRQDELIGFERFDSASRGPWGSVGLILWLKAKYAHPFSGVI
jgi:hypothetical protein